MAGFMTGSYDRLSTLAQRNLASRVLQVRRTEMFFESTAVIAALRLYCVCFQVNRLVLSLCISFKPTESVEHHNI